jgi:hypothetical protein
MRRSSAIALWAACASLFGVAGCFPCGEGYPRIALEFEDCADATCGLAVYGDGGAELVQTLHPAEHGLRLAGPVRFELPLGLETGTRYTDGLWVEYVTTCDGPVAASYVQQDVEGTVFELVLTLPAGPDSDDGERAYRRSFTTLPPAPVREGPLADCDPYEGCPYTLTKVSVPQPRGVCTIDQFQIMQPESCRY